MTKRQDQASLSGAYAKAVGLLRPFDGICPQDCNLCEERETLVLIPGEDHLAPNDGRTRDLLRVMSEIDPQRPCPAQCSRPSSCSIYNQRPLDCRSFQVVPRFEADGKVSTEISRSHCPIADTLPDGFEEAVRVAWEGIEPHLPDEWKQAYNTTPVTR